MPAASPIAWSLPGHPDEVALASGGGRLWVAASTATPTDETVWLAEVVADGVAAATRLYESGACTRPALAAFEHGGALAIACAADRVVAAYRSGTGGDAVHWGRPIDGTPVHVAVVAMDARAWIAVEVVRGVERHVTLWSVDPATGAIADRGRLGDAATWSRWPALVAQKRALVVAWCEGPPREPGVVKIGRWSERVQLCDVSGDPGEAPALALLPDGAIAVAWHHGGATAAGDDRDASVVRAIDAAIVRLPGGRVVPISPPPGAGGSSPRGEDQGWELAALATERDGALWLVGRSTHGHHVARRRADGAWSAPTALDAGGWGGRGRRHALVIHDEGIWLARRAPDGLVIGPCPEPAPAIAATRPARVALRRVARPPGRGVLFGDLHQHTAHSDGCGSVEDLWIAARDGRGLDFAAVTDHDQFCRRTLGPATWQLTTSVAAAFDEPGRFVAIAGYEFTGPRHPGPGHKCIYFADRVPDRVPGRDLDALFALLREVGGIAVPHHVGWTGADFAHHDPAVQPVWEICSVHGCYEAEGGCATHPPRSDCILPGQFVRDALAAGLRFGFVGSTDSHGLNWHHGIARWRNPFRAGLACVVGAEPTRAGILAALRARRSYATTGAKIAVRAELDGAAMGSELPAATRGELVVEVYGTAPIRKIVLVERDVERALAIEGRERFASARARLEHRDGASYAYVRVEQADGEAAWTSPFWIG